MKNFSSSLPLLLAFLAGYVDAYGLLKLATFVSFMSGNTTQTGAYAGQQDWAPAIASAIAIVGFVCGAFIGGWLQEGAKPVSRRVMWAVVAAMLTIVVALEFFRTMSANASIAVLAVAMGMLNTTVAKLSREPISMAFVTGMLSRVGTHLAKHVRGVPLPDAIDAHDTHLRRAGLLALMWLCFIAGAVTLALVLPRLWHWSLVMPVVVLVVTAVIYQSESVA